MANLPQQKMPHIMTIGPQRVGTSWLDQYLRARGDVCLPAEVKETQFFEKHWDGSPTSYSEYFKPNRNQHKISMEITTTCFDDPMVAERIEQTLGHDIKLICPLREPVARSYSLYHHLKRYGIVFGNLQEAVIQEPRILTSSHYAEHIQRWFGIFGRENLHFVFLEDMQRDQIQWLQDMCSKLGIPYQPAPKELDKKINARTDSKNPILANLAQNTADILRAMRLYPIINAAKAVGLKSVFFGKDGKAKEPDHQADDLEWLSQQLFGEIEKTEMLLGQDIPAWKASSIKV